MAMNPNREWVSLSVCAKLMSCNSRTAARIMATAPVRVQCLPGLRPRYHRADTTNYVKSLIKQPKQGRQARRPAPSPVA